MLNSFYFILLFYSSLPLRADAHKQQQEQKQRQQDQQQEDEESGSVSVPTAPGTTTALTNQDQRKALKFGFSSKGGTSKVHLTSEF